jgi:uncharacterized FlgJ-related protein
MLFAPSATNSCRTFACGPHPKSMINLFPACLIMLLINSYALGEINIKGYELAKNQIENGLPKNIKKQNMRDESIEGLKEIINKSNDEKLKELEIIVEDLKQTIIENEKSQEYKANFIKRFLPICDKIDRQYGIPACVVLSQMIIESGWGGSNVTIMKSNILGMGNRPKNYNGEIKYYTVFIGDKKRIFPVKFLEDTAAFYFESVEDCIFFYVNRIMIDEKSKIFYGEVRDYIEKHKYNRPDDYIENVVYLISRNYHHNPNWYYAYIMKVIKENNLRKNNFIEKNKEKYKYAKKKKFKNF